MNVLLSTQLENLKIESEIVLSFFCHLLIDGGETEESESNWEKYMVLELLKNLFSDFLVLKLIFQQFDYNKLMKNVLKELFSVFMVYLQKPTLLLMTLSDQFQDWLQVPFQLMDLVLVVLLYMAPTAITYRVQLQI